MLTTLKGPKVWTMSTGVYHGFELAKMKWPNTNEYTKYHGHGLIAYLRHMLIDDMLPEFANDIMQIHDILRLKFEQTLTVCSTTSKPWMWGSGSVEQAYQGLRPLLAAQGVPEESLETRTRAAIRAIGAGPILTALQAKVPWKQLKVLGNQVRFQFVLPSELEKKVAAKPNNEGTNRPKGARKSKKTFDPPKPIDIDPAKVTIVPGTFESQGQVLAQINMHQVGPLAEGIILTKALEAEPYLRSGKPVSKGPLGLLLIHGPEEKWVTSLPQTPVTVACQCILNNEPLLIDATLIQLGSATVSKRVHPVQVPLDTLDVATIKLMVYRDEVTEDWASVSAAPVKYIVQQLPLLHLCTQEDCGCNAWHNQEKVQTDRAIVDLWRRQFLRAGFKPDTPSDAIMFTACVRIPVCLVDRLLACSGVGGVYTEPRTQDAKTVDPAYVIVWLPKLDRAELAHQRQLNPSAIGLARVGDRRGLRTLASSAPALHESLRPGSTYLPNGPRLNWLVGPVPFGTDRNGLTKALKSLPWEVKVLQPTQTLAGKGTLWAVQSISEPPATIIPMSHGDAVITRQRGSDDEPKTAISKPIATSETLALCGKPKPDPQTLKSTNADPLTTQDPWGSWTGSSKIPVQRTPDVNASLLQMENKIQEAVLAKLPTPAKTNDDLPARLQTLESQVQGLMSRQQTLEQNVQESSAKHSSELQQLQHHLQGQVEHQQQSMAAMFEAQMTQIRGLLSKRPRPDADADDMNLWRFGRTDGFFQALLGMIVLTLVVAWVCQSLPIACFRFGCCCAILISSFAWGRPSGRVMFLPSRPWMPFGVSTLAKSVILLLCVRFGEATNPGPGADSPAHTFSIGACNPSGLPNKAMVVQEHLNDVDLWLVSETHLSEMAMRRFRQSLKCAGSDFKYCVGGYPVAHRHHSRLAGQWNGVAALCKFPTRAIPHAWSQFVHRSSRVQVTTSLINHLWITSGIIYGETTGPTHPNHVHHNEMLVRAVASQVAFHCTGPRVVAGDWNIEDGEIPSFQMLRDAGFEEVQNVAHTRWGRPFQNTCKMSSRKDFLFLSPELLALLENVTIRTDVWADHVTLEATFRGHIHSVPRYHWKRPAACPWPKDFHARDIQWPTQHDSLEEQYHATWKAVEGAASSQSSTPLPPSTLGRGRPVRIKKSVGVIHAPLPAGRAGDVAPQFHGLSLQHARWFRQLRKLQEFSRLAKSPRANELTDRIRNAWGSICRSPGFQPDFATWWLTCAFKVQLAPVALPTCPPDAAVAGAIYASFTLAVRDLETKLKSQCGGYARLRRALQPNLVFQDIRPMGSEGVTLLVKPLQAIVTEVDYDNLQVTLDRLCQWDENKPVLAEGTSCQVVHVEDEFLWLSAVAHLRPGMKLTQIRLKGHVDESCVRNSLLPGVLAGIATVTCPAHSGIK